MNERRKRMAEKEVEFEKKIDMEKVIGFMEDLIKGLKERKIYIQSGDEYLTLCPTETVDLEIEAKQKIDRGKIAIQLKWKEKKQPEDLSLKISTREPAEPGAKKQDSGKNA